MAQAIEGMPPPRHGKARFQQWLVKSLAVISDQYVELRQVLVERVELGRLLAVIAHKELAQTETFRSGVSDSDQKRICTGAAGQAGCLRIQEGPLLRWTSLNLAGRKGIE